MEVLRTYQLPLQKSFDALDDLESFAETETYSLGTDSTIEFQEGASVTYRLHHVASQRTSVITVILDSTATSEYEQFKKFISALENYKNGKRSIRRLMRSKQIVPGDQISFNLRSAVLQEDGTLLYGSLVVRSAGSFLREILKRPIGGTDYKRLTVHTQDGFFPWYSPSLNEERFQFRLSEEPDVDVYRRKLEIVLLHMGVKNVATILYDPFATQFNHETIEDTAENLLLSRLPLNEDATFEECLDALDLHLPVVRRLQEVAGDLVPIYGRRETACIAIEFAAKSYRRLNISTPFPEKCIAETNFPFASDDKVIFNMTKKSPNIAEQMARFAGMTPAVRDGSFAFVYHATSWEAARKIASEGIDREAGRQNLDFGQRRSFYVAMSFTMAARWAKLKRGLFNRQCAILVFTLPREQAENAGLVWKTIEYPNQWKDIVTKSRAGQKTAIDKDVDFAEGPYLVDASVAPLTVNNCQPSQDYQIAAKTDRTVDFLYGNLIGTIYFSQEETDDHILHQF